MPDHEIKEVIQHAIPTQLCLMDATLNIGTSVLDVENTINKGWNGCHSYVNGAAGALVLVVGVVAGGAAEVDAVGRGAGDGSQEGPAHERIETKGREVR